MMFSVVSEGLITPESDSDVFTSKTPDGSSLTGGVDFRGATNKYGTIFTNYKDKIQNLSFK